MQSIGETEGNGTRQSPNTVRYKDEERRQRRGRRKTVLKAPLSWTITKN